MFLALVPLFFLVGSYGYSTGPPTGFCRSPHKRPFHEMHLPMNTIAPYRMDVTATTYRPKEKINITLRGVSPVVKFKGFFISAETSSTLFRGPVSNMTDNVRTVPFCGMSHTDNSSKSAVTISWEPPSDYHIGSIQFIAVVVSNFSTFWANVRTETIMPDFTMYKSYEQLMQEMREKANRSLQMLQQQQQQQQQQANTGTSSGTVSQKPESSGSQPIQPQPVISPTGVQKQLGKLLA